MKKRIVALFMIMILGLTCLTACGDKDDEKDSGKKKKSAKSYESVYDIVDALQKFEKGTVILTIDADAGEQGHVNGTINAITDGKGNFKIGISADVNTKDQKMNMSADDVIIIKDKMAYINLAEIIKVAGAAGGAEVADMFANMNLGYFAVPLPDDLDITELMSVITGFADGSSDFLKAALKDAEVTGEKGDFSIKFTNAQSYKTFLSATADYMEKKTPDIEKAINNNSLDKIDLNAYVKKLLDYYGEDINILASAAGVEQAQIDALINEIKSQDLNAAVKDELEGEIGNADEIKGSLTEAIGKIRKAAEDLTDEQMKDQNLEMTVKATDTGFKIKGTALLKDDGNEVKADYSIRISDDVSSISAPSNITKLRDFKDVLASLAPMLGGLMNGMDD